MIRLVGDLHGAHIPIVDMLKSCHYYDCTIQLGDFGVGFGAESYIELATSDKLRVLHGNHDNPSILARYPHDLGRFGFIEIAGVKIFFVAGAWSIDQADRIPGLSWWQEEELNMIEGNECLDLWEKYCKDVDVVISHDGPPNATQFILRSFPRETYTGKLLWEMWKIHNPPAWYFGHWHKSFEKKIGQTVFRCLGINEVAFLSSRNSEQQSFGS